MEHISEKQFQSTMSVLRSSFSSLPAWAQGVAYMDFCRQQDEITSTMTGIDQHDVETGLWSVSAVERYMQSARDAQNIAQFVADNVDKLQQRSDMDTFIRREIGYFAKANHVNPRIAQYTLDHGGEHNRFTARFYSDGRTHALTLFGFPIDLKTGMVQEKQKHLIVAPQKEVLKQSRPKMKGVNRMNQYEVHVTPVSLEDSGIKAFADVKINDAIHVSGIRIMDGEKGLFVSMPSYPKQKDGELTYQDLVFPKTAEARQELTAAVLDTYYPQSYTEQTVGEKADMPINVRVTPISDLDRDHLRGLGTATIGDFVISNLQLRETEQNGLYVGMPFRMAADRNTGEVEYKKVVTLSPELMKHVRGMMTMEYKHALDRQEQGMSDRMAAAKEAAQQQTAAPKDDKHQENAL